ncbi:hypothetical protein [Endozoicomonas sp. GU-1]|uniref:hypothetical protein n=1 Tax=Endozoicomonas sp. GU-1 TaxID=3009078 RepID=UPI0022B33D2D|nr:hypothetical protein [Endozoicomonas sp. GU-1]WBA80501.1 hypothetical protein O2T12_19500 [Endozoicomonas sp. GU-1]WBA88066.1 hypothetical protein O3276_08705 [Endozoicomonas sp. GU-1]
MNFDKINLRPDSGNDFSANSQDTESGQVDFGPFRVDISPNPADTHLSQAGGASTEADLRDKLKIVLDPDLLDKFCQQVINK